MSVPTSSVQRPKMMIQQLDWPYSLPGMLALGVSLMLVTVIEIHSFGQSVPVAISGLMRAADLVASVGACWMSLQMGATDRLLDVFVSGRMIGRY